MKLSIVHYVTEAGKDLYQAWLERLKDRTAQAAITRRLIRAESGDLGDHKRIGDGVSELRIDVGPGYRVYYGSVGTTMVVILIAGTKATQQRDVLRAKTYWQDFQERYGNKG